MTKTTPNFIQLQYQFAAHIRDPQQHPAPAQIEERRLKIYRELFYNNIESFIASGFPVLRKLYNDIDWHNLVRQFFSQHHSHSPYFLQISQEFLQYLHTEHTPLHCDPPFLLELAHYEWVELALSVSNSEPDPNNIDSNAELLHGHPCISPLAWLLSYQWPVHQISPDYRPTTPPSHATHIIVYRDRKDLVRFIITNPVTARLIQLLQTNPNLTSLTALQYIATELHHPNPDIVINGGKQTLEELKAKGIILGIRLQTPDHSPTTS